MSLSMFPVLLQGRGQVGRYIRCQWSIRQTAGEDSSRWPQLVLHVKGVDSIEDSETVAVVGGQRA